MFYYINQPRSPPFPTGLVKTESDFVRSFDTDRKMNAVFLPIFNWMNYDHIINYQKDVNQITLNQTTL